MGQTDAAGRRAPEGGFRGHGRLGSKVVVVVGSQGVGAVLGYAALLAIGRYYAPGAYGAYLFAVSLVGIAGTLFQLGFTQAHQREIARGLPIPDALGVYARIRIVLAMAMAGTLLLALWFWLGPLGKGFTGATSLALVLIILASSLVGSGRRIATDTWVAQGRVHRAEWCNAVDSLTYAALVVLVGLGFGAASGRWIPAPGLGTAVADALGLAADPGILLLARYIALAHFAGKVAAVLAASAWWLRDGTRVGPWDPALAVEYRQFALPVALTGVLALVLQHTDVLMLGYFWTTREVGLYGAAQRLANIALLANIAIRGLLMPYFASLLGRGEGERASRTFRQVERFLLLAVIPVALAMIVWAEQGIHIFVGDGFLAAAPALQWLAAWTFVSAMNLPVRAKHLAAGHTQVLLRAVTLNATANVALNLVLIPDDILGVPLAGMGPEGAAVATFASSLLAYAYNRYQAHHHHGIALLDRSQLRMFAAGLAPLALWLWLHATLPPTAYDRVWELVLLGLSGAALYAVALVATRGVRREDIPTLRAALRPRSVLNELRGRD